MAPCLSDYRSLGIPRRAPKRHAARTVIDESIEPRTDASAQTPAPKFQGIGDTRQHLPGTFVTDGLRVDCSRFLVENRQRATVRRNAIETHGRFS